MKQNKKKEVGNVDCISGEAGAGRTCVRKVTWIEYCGWLISCIFSAPPEKKTNPKRKGKNLKYPLLAEQK